jgi:hypothetical protein
MCEALARCLGDTAEQRRHVAFMNRSGLARVNVCSRMSYRLNILQRVLPEIRLLIPR